MKKRFAGYAALLLLLVAFPAYSRTVTDMLGRSVELPDKIERAADTSSVARLLTYGGCADRLVGVTRMDQSNKVAMPYTAVNADHFATLAVVGAGGNKDEVYYEALASLDTQVIFTNRPGPVADKIFEKRGFPPSPWSIRAFLTRAFTTPSPCWAKLWEQKNGAPRSWQP